MTNDSGAHHAWGLIEGGDLERKPRESSKGFECLFAAPLLNGNIQKLRADALAKGLSHSCWQCRRSRRILGRNYL